MPKSKFGFAPREISDEVSRLREARYPELDPVSIKVLMTTAVLKEHDVEVDALAEVTKEKVRLGGGPDVWLVIDEERWRIIGMQVRDADRLRIAILDRLLFGLSVMEDKNGNLLTDGHDRPVVKIRPADWLLSGYREIAERHGRYAPEVIEARKLKEDFGPYLFPMDDDPGDAALARAEDVEAETIRALISVGHTGEQARAMIAAATRDGRSYPSVAALVEGCYEARAEGGAAEATSAPPAKPAKVSTAAAKAARKLVADLAPEGMSVELSAGSTAAKAPRKPKGGAATAATAR